MTIRPEELRGDLEAGRARAGAEQPPAGPASLAAAALPEDERERLIRTISASYFLLRRGLAVIALAFPVVLWLGAGVDQLQSSISAYYHFHETANGGPSPYGSGETRDVFVGVLWAIGAFLFFYKGYSRREDWVLNIAGIAAVLIALFPMDWPGEPGTTTNMVHFASGVVFFLAIAYVCLFCSGDTLRIIADGEKRRRFKRLYALLGMLMVVLPLSLFLIHFLSDRLTVLPEDSDESRVVLGIEVAMIWVFAAFWLAKSREIALIQKQVALPVQ